MRCVVCLAVLCLAAVAHADKPISKSPDQADVLRGRAEIQEGLLAKRKQLADAWQKFLKTNKQLAENSKGNEELMSVFRPYGAAVIRLKKQWSEVVKHTDDFGTWHGTSAYDTAWTSLMTSWNALQPLVDRFAEYDVKIADQLTASLDDLRRAFHSYAGLADEWDGQLGNGPHKFTQFDKQGLARKDDESAALVVPVGTDEDTINRTLESPADDQTIEDAREPELESPADADEAALQSGD